MRVSEAIQQAISATEAYIDIKLNQRAMLDREIEDEEIKLEKLIRALEELHNTP